MRYPYTHEEPTALRQLLRQIRQFKAKCTEYEWTANITDLWNTATCPFVYRSEREHRTCKRIARVCKRLIARHGLRVIELGSGALVAKKPA